MNPIQEIIQQAQRDLYCPTCGRSFALNEIRLRGMFDHTLLLQTVCTNGHSPVIMIFVASYNQEDVIQPINTDDIIKVHNALKDFDGDFQAVWGKGKK